MIETWIAELNLWSVDSLSDPYGEAGVPLKHIMSVDHGFICICQEFLDCVLVKSAGFGVVQLLVAF